MACAAIAGSIFAGCAVDSGTYRPRRCTAGAVLRGRPHRPRRHRGAGSVEGLIGGPRRRVGNDHTRRHPAVTSPRGPARFSVGVAGAGPGEHQQVDMGNLVHRRQVRGLVLLRHRSRGPAGEVGPDDNVLQVEQVRVLRRRDDPAGRIHQNAVGGWRTRVSTARIPPPRSMPGGEHAQPPVDGRARGVGEIGQHEIDRPRRFHRVRPRGRASAREHVPAAGGLRRRSRSPQTIGVGGGCRRSGGGVDQCSPERRRRRARCLQGWVGEGCGHLPPAAPRRQEGAAHPVTNPLPQPGPTAYAGGAQTVAGTVTGTAAAPTSAVRPRQRGGLDGADAAATDLPRGCPGGDFSGVAGLTILVRHGQLLRRMRRHTTGRR